MMADGPNQNVLSPSAQPAQASTPTSLAYPAPENITTDSSAAMSLPLDSSGAESPNVALESLLSPTPATSALPPRPNSALSASAATPDLSTSNTQAPVSAPRMRGGFEIDDDEENTEETEPGKDEVDVYDPEVGYDIDASTPAHVQTPLDRTSQSPERENGTTPVPVQTSSSLDGAASSTLATGADSTVASAGQFAQAPVESQAKATSSRSDVNGSLLPTVSKSRLAHDVVGILEDRVKDDPRGDADAYLELINELKSRNKEDEVRKIYNDYLKVFPFDAEQWCAYIRWEEQHDRKYQMEQLFNKSLLSVLNVELWSIYINYIRRRNSMAHGDTANAFKIINQSFSFALDTIGMDKDAGKLWQEYIGFLKSGPGTVGGSKWEDGAKADTLRAAYQRAIAVPTEAVTQIWREYDAFETGLSKINGRKYLQDKSASYMTARQAYHQLSNLTTGLKRTTRPRLPPALGYEGDANFQYQLNLWQDWISWEKEDPLVLKDDEVEVYRKRILYAYKQSLMALEFWPEMWYSAAEFCFENGLESEGAQFLEQGLSANPESPLLAFKQADRLETTTQNDESKDPGAKERMKNVREPYDKVLDALYALVKKVSSREREDIQDAESAAEANVDGDGNEDDEVNAANIASKRAALDAQIAVIKRGAEDETELLSKMISHVWIALMRATRRIQGKGSTPGGGFRAIFGEARKRGKVTSDFYVECAQIEWQCYRDPAGAKILERGIKLFPEDAYLPLQYMKHLFEINDVTNARGVFETTVSRLLGHQNPPFTARTKPLFVFLHDYESRFGELVQVQKLEKRMRELFPDDPLLKLFADRHATETFDPIHVFPIVSRQQVKPKTQGIVPSVEVEDAARSPTQKVIDSITTVSPKRPLPDDFEDSPVYKMARAESPLKGAAGRRIIQQRQPNGQPAAAPPLPLPPPLAHQISDMLGILPRASAYVEVRFDAAKIVDLIREAHLPPPSSLPTHYHQVPPPMHAPPPQHIPPQQHASPAWQQYQQQPPPPMPVQGYMQPTTVSQTQYGGAPFRFA